MAARKYEGVRVCTFYLDYIVKVLCDLFSFNVHHSMGHHYTLQAKSARMRDRWGVQKVAGERQRETKIITTLSHHVYTLAYVTYTHHPPIPTCTCHTHPPSTHNHSQQHTPVPSKCPSQPQRVLSLTFVCECLHKDHWG